MAGTTTNLIQGAGILYTGAFGATEPADTSVGTAPASGDWTDVGFTKDGVSLSYSPTFSELEVDQIMDVVERRITRREFRVSTNMAEVTLDNLNLALNGSVSSTGVGYESFEPEAAADATSPTYVALIFDGLAPGTDKMRRFIVRKALNVSDVEVVYQKDEQTVLAVEFHAHYVSSAIKPWKIVDEA